MPLLLIIFSRKMVAVPLPISIYREKQKQTIERRFEIRDEHELTSGSEANEL